MNLEEINKDIETQNNTEDRNIENSSTPVVDDNINLPTIDAVKIETHDLSNTVEEVKKITETTDNEVDKFDFTPATEEVEDTSNVVQDVVEPVIDTPAVEEGSALEGFDFTPTTEEVEDTSNVVQDAVEPVIDTPAVEEGSALEEFDFTPATEEVEDTSNVVQDVVEPVIDTPVVEESAVEKANSIIDIDVKKLEKDSLNEFVPIMKIKLITKKLWGLVEKIRNKHMPEATIQQPTVEETSEVKVDEKPEEIVTKIDDNYTFTDGPVIALDEDNNLSTEQIADNMVENAVNESAVVEPGYEKTKGLGVAAFTKISLMAILTSIVSVGMIIFGIAIMMD